MTDTKETDTTVIFWSLGNLFDGFPKGIEVKKDFMLGIKFSVKSNGTFTDLFNDIFGREGAEKEKIKTFRFVTSQKLLGDDIEMTENISKHLIKNMLEFHMSIGWLSGHQLAKFWECD